MVAEPARHGPFFVVERAARGRQFQNEGRHHGVGDRDDELAL
jgi:hypothetical protein